jgi:hypothetical protein
MLFLIIKLEFRLISKSSVKSIDETILSEIENENQRKNFFEKNGNNKKIEKRIKMALLNLILVFSIW